MRVPDLGDGSRQHCPAGGDQGPDAYAARHLALQRRDFRLGLSERRENLCGSAREDPARFGESYTAALRFEERNTDLALEFVQLLRNSGGCDMQGAGGSRY